ncbi:MAG: IPExxxVDY family protein [Daejeonella sp.]
MGDIYHTIKSLKRFTFVNLTFLIVLNKTTLKFELDLDFVLVAITAQLKDYVFCFKINKQLGTDFSKITDLEMLFSNDEELFYFSRYFYLTPESETEYYIIANKGTEGFLVPEMRKVDFFLLIRNYIDKEDLRRVISGLNKIPEVLVAAEVDPKKLKSKENLIF